jgi:hypothetical protein
VLQKPLRDPATDADARKKTARAIAKRIDRLGLDIKQPADLERLRDIILADGLDGPGLGRPPRWGRDALFELGASLWFVTEGGRWTLRKKDAAALIRKNIIPPSYRHDNPRAVSRRLLVAQRIVEKEGVKDRLGTRYGTISLIRDQKSGDVLVGFGAELVDLEEAELKLTPEETEQLAAMLAAMLRDTGPDQ